MKNSQIFQTIKTNFPKLSKEIIFVMLGQVIAALGSLFGVRLLTGKVTPAVYGEISLGLTIGVLFQQLLFGPLANSYLRFFSIADEKKEITPFIKAVKRSSFQATLISLAIIVCIIIGFLFKGYSKLVGLILLSFLFMLISSYNTFLDNLQNAARQRIIVAWHQGIGSWLKYVCTIIMIVLISPSSAVAMGGFLFSTLIILASQLLFFSHSKFYFGKEKEKVESIKIEQWCKTLWNYASPFIFWGLFSWAQQSSDRWALGLFVSTTEVGLYTALYQIGYYPVVFFSGVVLQFLSPILFQWSGDASHEAKMLKIAKFTRSLVIISILLSLLLALLAKIFHTQIFSLLVSSEYKSVSSLLPLMVLAGGIFSSGQFATVHFLNEINPQKLLFSKISTSIFGFAINFIFASLWGIRGIVIGMLGYSIVYFIFIVFLVRSNLKLDFPEKF